MSWARLLKRVFDIDIEHCPNCGGALKIIAAIEYPPVIVKILSHLGLPTRAPDRRVDLFQTIGEAQTAERPKPMETLALSASNSEIVTLAGDPTSALSEPTEAKPRISVRSPMIETLAG